LIKKTAAIAATAGFVSACTDPTKRDQGPAETCGLFACMR
jgi:hypothetical protein